MTPEAVLKATSLIKTGEVSELGHALSASMPFFGTRRFDVNTKRTSMNTPPNERGSNEEIVITEIGHVGTHLAGFTHMSHRNSLSNCFEIDEISTRSGFEAPGTDKVGMLLGRGVRIEGGG